MNATYSTRISFTDKYVVVESLINNVRVVDTCVRGINENIAVAEFALRHKQQADELLQTDTAQNIAARLAVDLRQYSTRDIYGSKV